MKKILLLLSFLGLCQIAAAQQWYKLSSLQKQLSESRPDTSRINIYLKLAEFEIFKLGEYKTDLDSAADYINDAEQLNHSLNSAEAPGYITIERSYLAKDREDRKTGKTLMEKAIRQLSITHNKYLLGRAYQGLADYYDYLNPSEQSTKIAFTQIAANLFKSAGYVEQEAFCYKNLAEIIPNRDTALKKLNEALIIYKSINYKKLQGVYDLYAQYYVTKCDFKKALQYDLTALKTEEDQHDHDGTLCEIENHIGLIYRSLGDYPNQIRFFKMGISVASDIQDINSLVEITVNLACSYLAWGQPLNAKELLNTLSKYNLSNASIGSTTIFFDSKLKVYTILKEFDKAKQASADLIKILKNNALDPENKCEAYFDLITYFMESKQYADAKKYLLITDEVVKKVASPVHLQTANGLWFRLDTAQHDYKSATYHGLIQKKFIDSIYKLNKLQDIQRLQIQFDTKEKENQIFFLQQRSRLEMRNLQEANVVKDYTIGGIILLFIMAGLLYRQNILKQRNNKDINKKNSQLQHLLDEKEWLLKEVHHRVKNNLHTVICLLESQAAYLENDALKAIENSQHRIYAMSLIHQKLYQTGDIKTIDMDAYLEEFIQYLDDSFGNPANVKLQYEIEPIKLGIAQAISVGLIINEAVTNSYKHAFPDNREGVIKITLNQSGDSIELIAKDNGIGMTITDNFDDDGSLGLQLIKGLSRDLNAELKLEGTNGTCAHIEFEINLSEKAVSALSYHY
jgi:two-component system, sensor histidine kinase PdtaS